MSVAVHIFLSEFSFICTNGTLDRQIETDRLFSDPFFHRWRPPSCRSVAVRAIPATSTITRRSHYAFRAPKSVPKNSQNFEYFIIILYHLALICDSCDDRSLPLISLQYFMCVANSFQMIQNILFSQFISFSIFPPLPPPTPLPSNTR